LAGFARWCFHHRKAVLAAWLIALVGLLVIGFVLVKASYSDTFSLPGTDSAAAQDVSAADFPVHTGDSGQIVVQARQGTLRSPAIEAAVSSMLAKVSRLPRVRSVDSPYRPAGQISRDGTIGFATVAFDASAATVPKAAVTTLISTARSADSSLLHVALGGQSVEYNTQGGERRRVCSSESCWRWSCCSSPSAVPSSARSCRSSRHWSGSGWPSRSSTS
jgi:putative drug exporter of the RND superfamily